ncbi:MAG TPA: DUF6265 family protein, partial [Thermoanaerobaculia bacterium]|nr:DUF6265 family protein [Thermoanaerobaculia bacterium]
MLGAVAALLLASALPAIAADLPSWMAGSWQLKTGDVTMEEHWTSPGGGVMLGMHRDVTKDGRTSFEFLRIEKKKDGSLVYLAMPGGRPATPFPLKSAT